MCIRYDNVLLNVSNFRVRIRIWIYFFPWIDFFLLIAGIFVVDREYFSEEWRNGYCQNLGCPFKFWNYSCTFFTKYLKSQYSIDFFRFLRIFYGIYVNYYISYLTFVRWWELTNLFRYLKSTYLFIFTTASALFLLLYSVQTRRARERVSRCSYELRASIAGQGIEWKWRVLVQIPRSRQKI